MRAFLVTLGQAKVQVVRSHFVGGGIAVVVEVIHYQAALLSVLIAADLAQQL